MLDHRTRTRRQVVRRSQALIGSVRAVVITLLASLVFGGASGQGAPVIANPGLQNALEDVPFAFASISDPALEVTAPDSNLYRAIVEVTSGDGVLDNGVLQLTLLAAEGDRPGINAFMQGLEFVGAQDWFGTATIRIEVTSNRSAQTPENTTVVTFDIAVAPEPDPPVTGAIEALAAIEEDTANPPGALVSALLTGFSDVDGDALAGVAISQNAASSAQGTWQYSTDAGASWFDVGSVSRSSALLLPASARLRFLPAQDWWGAPGTLRLHAVDDNDDVSENTTFSSGATRVGANVDAGHLNLDAVGGVLTTEVTPVNDPPTTVDAEVGTDKNVPVTFGLTSSDVDSCTDPVLDACVVSYRIVTLPDLSTGTLEVRVGGSYQSASAGQIVARADAEASNGLRFTPALNVDGTTSFAFQAIDAAGAESNESSVTITVSELNEPPSLTVPGPLTMDEDTTLALEGITVADLDAGVEPLELRLSVSIVEQGPPGSFGPGALTFADTTGLTLLDGFESPGSDVRVRGTLAALNAALADANLSYEPEPDFFGEVRVSVFVDDLGSGLGESDAKTDSATIDVSVTNVPDRPVTGTATLGGIPVNALDLAGERVADLWLGVYFDADGDALVGVLIAGDASTASQGRWEYSANNGISWSLVGAVAPDQALALSAATLLRFVPASGYFGEVGSLTVHAVDASVDDAITFSTATLRSSVDLGTLSGATFVDLDGGALEANVVAEDTPFRIVNDQPLRVKEGGVAVLTKQELLVEDDEASAAQIVYTVLEDGTSLSEGAFWFDSAGDGTFATAITAGFQFTQAQLNAGLVRYEHSGVEPAVPQVLAYSVTDEIPVIGGTSAERTLQVLVTPVNDPPELFVPGDTPPGGEELAFVVPQGGSLAFSDAAIVAIDPDNTDEQLIFRIESAPAHGELTFRGSLALQGRTFSYADLLAGELVYTHGGSTALADSFDVTLRDGAGGVVERTTVPITITEVNTPPSIRIARATVFERRTAPLELVAIDAETASGDLIVSITSLPPVLAGEGPDPVAVLEFDTTGSGDWVAYTADRLADGATPLEFPLSDLERFRILHTSENRIDPANFSFGIRVTDGGTSSGDQVLSTDATVQVRVRPVNDDPVLCYEPNTLALDLAVSNTGTVTGDQLCATDAEGDTITYRLETRPAHGALLRDGVPMGVGATFTQADVDAGFISYRHNQTANASDSFTVTVRDGNFNVVLNRPGGVYVDDDATTLRPVVVPIAIDFVVDQDTGAPIGSGGTPLDPIDPVTGGTPWTGGEQTGSGGTAIARDVFLTSEATRGQVFEVPTAAVLANDSGTAPLSVTSVDDVAGGKGSVTLDGATIVFTPEAGAFGVGSFSYTMQDDAGDSASATVSFYILYVNLPPELSVNEPLVLDEGASATLTPAVLQVSDLDQGPGELVITLTSDPRFGELRRCFNEGCSDFDPLLSGDNFTQADVNAGRIRYQHDGGELFLAGFDFTYTDGSEFVLAASFVIDVTPVNDRPVISRRQPDPVVLQGESVLIDTSVVTVSDSDGIGTDKPEHPLAQVNVLTLQATSQPVVGELRLVPPDGTYDQNDPSSYDVVTSDTVIPRAALDLGRLWYWHDNSVFDEAVYGPDYQVTVTLEVDDNVGASNSTASTTLTVRIAPQNVDPVVDPNLEPGDDDGIVIVNETLEVYEGATRTVTPASLAAIDPDNTPNQVQFRLVTTPTRGQLLRDGAPLGVNSAFSQADIDAERIAYRHDGSETTSDTVRLRLSDGGGGDEPIIDFQIQILPVNDPPTITTPGNRVGAEDTPLALVGISIADPDSVDADTGDIDTTAGPFTVTVTSVTGIGTFSVTAAGDATVSGGGADDPLEISGTLGDVNATLATLVYLGRPNANGIDTVRVRVSDGGYFGADPDDMLVQAAIPGIAGDGDPGAESAETTFLVNVRPVNDAPEAIVPGAQETPEDTALVFSAATGNALQVDDLDIVGDDASDPDIALRTTISVSFGTLTLTDGAGLTVTGDGTATLTVTGALGTTNAALAAGVTYLPDQDFNDFQGDEELILTVDDQGNIGAFGGTLDDSATVAISVTPVNDAPVTNDLAWVLDEDTFITFSLESSDVDGGNDPVTDAIVTHYLVIVSADDAETAGLVGTLRTSDAIVLDATTSVVPAGVTDTLPAGTHVITVAQATNMTYEPPANYHSGLSFSGADRRSSFTFRAIDILDTGDVDASSRSEPSTAAISVNAVNDAPVLTGGGDEVTYTEGPGDGVAGTPVRLNAAADLVVTDVELTELNDGGQNEASFADSSVRVQRAGGVVTTDRYGLDLGSIAGLDDLTLDGATLQRDATTIATRTQDGSAGELVITFSADATRDDVHNVMRRVTFASVEDNLASASVQLVFNDGNTDGQQGSGDALDSNAITFSVTVVNVNNPPRFTDDVSITLAEDVPSEANTGSLLSVLMSPVFTDPDAPLAGANLAGIAVFADAADAATEGRWQYSSDDGATWFDVSAGSDLSLTNALVLPASARVRFAPVADFNSAPRTIGGPGGGPGALGVMPIDDSDDTRAYTEDGTRVTIDTTGVDPLTSDVGTAEAARAEIRAVVTQVNDAPQVIELGNEDYSLTYEEAVGVNVAGTPILLDTVGENNPEPAQIVDVELTVRGEATFEGARLEVQQIDPGSGSAAPDPLDLFVLQTGNGLSVSGGFTSPGAGIVLFNSGSIVTFGGVIVATVTDNSLTSGRLLITFNAAATPAAVNQVLRNLVYSNTDPTLEAGEKDIAVDFYDGNGIGAGTQGTGGELSGRAVVKIGLVPTNDSPSLTSGAQIAAVEDEGPAGGDGTTFFALLDDFLVDPDEIEGNSLASVAIARVHDEGLGDWQVDLGSGWVSLADFAVAGGIAPERALVLEAIVPLRFVPDEHANTDGRTLMQRPRLELHAIEAEVPAGAARSGEEQDAGPIPVTTGVAAEDTATYDVTLPNNTPETRVSADAVDIDVVIAARNDAPVLAGSGLTIALTESPVAGVGTPTALLLDEGAPPTVTDLDLATTATLDPNTFGAGSVRVTLTDRVAGDRFTLAGAPLAGVQSTSGDDADTGDFVVQFTQSATLAQVNAVLAALTYEHTSDNPPTGARSYSVVVNDGNNLQPGGDAGGPSALDSNALTGTIEITGQNDPPELVATALNPTFTEALTATDATPVALYSGASIDTIQPDESILRIDLTVSGLQSDGVKSRLASDEHLTLNGVEFPLVTGTIEMVAGEAGAVLSGTVTVTRTDDVATVSVVPLEGEFFTTAQTEALVNTLGYRNVSEWPLDGPRVVTITLLQDDGGTAGAGVDTQLDAAKLPPTSTVTVVSVNDAPTMALSIGGTFTEGGTALVFGSAASVADVDAVHFQGGSLTVTLDAGVPGYPAFLSGDELLIEPGGGITLDGTSVLFGFAVIGTVAGGDEAPLVVSFTTTDATLAAVEALLERVAYRSTNENPTWAGAAPTRALTLTLNDGGNTGTPGSNSPLTATVTGSIDVVGVNDAPTLDGWTGRAANTHVQGGAPVVIDTSATLADLDLEALAETTPGDAATAEGDWSGSTLRIERWDTDANASDANADDLFGASGVVAFDGTTLRVDGVAVGTVTNTGGVLSITFNESATTARVQQVLRSITYANALTTPGALSYDRVDLRLTFDDQNSNDDGGGTAGSGQDQGTGGQLSVSSVIELIINRLPVVQSDTANVDEPIGDTEDDATSVSGNVIAGSPDDAGEDTDPDAAPGEFADVLRVQGVAAGTQAGPLSANVGSSVVGQYGTLVLNANGAFTYTVDATNGDVQALAVGESHVDVFTYTVTDDRDGAPATGTTTLTITIDGTNDAPSVTAASEGSDALTRTETTQTLAGTGSLSVFDVDRSDTVEASFELTSAVQRDASNGDMASDVDQPATDALEGFFTLNPDNPVIGSLAQSGTIGWSFDTDGANPFSYLALNETLTLTYRVTVTDSQEATDTHDVTVTIVGSNQPPSVTPIEVAGAVVEDEHPTALTDAGSFEFTDVDTSDRSTVSVAYADASASGAASVSIELNAALASAITLAGAGVDDPDEANEGTVTWSFEIANALVQYLAAGEVVTATYTATVDDGNATTPQTITVTITGVNDAPVITATPEQLLGAVTQAADTAGATLVDSDTIAFDDVDATDTSLATVVRTSTVPSSGVVVPGGLATALESAMTLSGAGVGTRANNGTVTWTFTLENDLVRFLRVDESIVVTYTITVTDTADGTDEVDVVVTIQGSNDQPSVSATPPSDFTEAADASAQTLSQSGTVSFDDVDVNDLVTITFTSNGAPVWTEAIGGATPALPEGLGDALVAGFATGVEDAAVPGTTP